MWLLWAINPNISHKEIVAHDMTCLTSGCRQVHASPICMLVDLVVDPEGYGPILKFFLDLGILGEPLILIEGSQGIIDLGIESSIL
jgi:hypothetical protein